MDIKNCGNYGEASVKSESSVFFNKFDRIKQKFTSLLEVLFEDKAFGELPGQDLYNMVLNNWSLEKEAIGSIYFPTLVNSVPEQDYVHRQFVDHHSETVFEIYQEILDLEKIEASPDCIKEFQKIYEIVVTMQKTINYRNEYFSVEDLFSVHLEELTTQTSELMEDNSTFSFIPLNDVLSDLIKFRQIQDKHANDTSSQKLITEINTKTDWNVNFAFEKIEDFLSELIIQMNADIEENNAMQSSEGLNKIRGQWKGLNFTLQKYLTAFPQLQSKYNQFQKLGTNIEDYLIRIQATPNKKESNQEKILTREKRKRTSKKNYWIKMKKYPTSRVYWQFIGLGLLYAWAYGITSALGYINSQDRINFLDKIRTIETDNGLSQCRAVQLNFPNSL